MKLDLNKYIVTTMGIHNEDTNSSPVLRDNTVNGNDLRSDGDIQLYDTLIIIYEIKESTLYNEFLKRINKTNSSNILDYFDSLLSEFERLSRNRIIAKLLLMDTAFKVSRHEIETINSVKEALSKHLFSLVKQSDQLLSFIYTMCKSKIDKDKKTGAISDDPKKIDFKLNITYHYSLIKTQININDFVIKNSLKFESARDVLNYGFADMIQNKIQLNRCENCGKYFIPKTRSNEKYCGNVLENGRTCKEVAFDIKVENDEALRVYRSVYKTQNARLQRNSKGQSEEYRDILHTQFCKWRNYAKSLMQKCRVGDMEVKDMKKEIENDSWMIIVEDAKLIKIVPDKHLAKGDDTNSKH